MINWSFTDENGKLSFIIDTIPLNTDSVYFYIKAEDNISCNENIFMNELNLFECNKISNYIITIVGFKRFTKEEYQKYVKKNKLLPGRKKR